MTIQRLSIHEGYPIWGPTDPAKVADRLLQDRADEIVTLEPGEYDMTPTIGPGRNKQTEQLIVFDDGTGLVRLTPEDASMSLYNWGKPGTHSEKPAGQGAQIHLPHDRQRLYTITEHHERIKSGVPLMIEIIRWLEDTQP